MTDIDPYPVSELTNRYNIGKQAVYNRLEALSIKPAHHSNRSYISSAQLLLLDRLHEHIASGGTMADFEPSQTESSISPVDVSSESTGLPRTDDLVILVERIAAALKPATSPLGHWEQLEKAVAHNWLLTTTDVKRVIGVKPKGNSFTRGSFTFVRSGMIGNQTSWRVVKKEAGGMGEGSRGFDVSAQPNGTNTDGA
jgi:hypothetical protein